MIGQTVSHYKILEKLGEGGMGMVFEAEDLKLGRRVALKFLPPRLQADNAAKKRFVHEAKAASALDHPNIGTIYEIDETRDGQMFIAMACYDGGTLKQKVESGPVAAGEAIDIVSQVASGLAKAHDSGIVHRDIKPGNILTTTDGLVKVVDFGLAKLSGTTRVTRTGTTVGTVAYMSPEQARGEEVDPSSDVFSLGVVLYELLTGKLPFRGDHEAAVIYSIMNVDPEPLDTHRPDLPVGLQNVVDKSLTKDSELRYQNAGEMVRELEEIQRGGDIGAIQKRRPRVSMRTALTAAAVAVAVVAVGIFGWRAFSSGGQSPLFVTENRVAVLPIENMMDHRAEVFANGLSEAVSDVVEEIARGDESMWVIPYYKVAETPIATPTDAIGAFGVNRVVLGRLQRFADVLRVTLRLCRALDLREVRSVVLNFDNETGAGLADSLAYRVGELMDVDPASLESACALHPANASAMVSYVTGLGWMQRYREGTALDSAAMYLDRSVTLDPTFAMGHTALGLASLRYYMVTKEASRLRPAIEHFENALRIEPELVYANLHCGVAHFYMEDHPRAIESFQAALSAVPGHPRASRRLGRIYRVQGRYDEAESAYHDAVRHFPDYWMTHFELGLFHYYSDELDKAIEAWRETLKYAPNDVTTINNIGAAYHNAGEWGPARQYFERAFRIRPTCESCQNMGLAAFFEGKYEGSTRYYEFALEYCDTTDYDTWGNLAAAMYFTDGRRSEAAEVFRTAIRHLKREFLVSPENPTLIAAMITYHAMSGDERSSRRMIQYGDSIAGDDDDVLFAIGDAYELFGQRQLALRYIGDAIRHGYVFAEVEWTPNLKDLMSDPLFKQMTSAEGTGEPTPSSNAPVEE